MILRDVVEFCEKGVNIEKSLIGDVMYIPSGAVFPEFIKKDKCYKIVSETSNIKSDYFLKNGDVLFNTGGVGTLGRVGFYNLSTKAVCDPFVLILRGKEGVLDNRYLFYQLQSNRIKDLIFKNTVGSTGITSIKKSDILSFPIHLPTLATQKRIAEILDAADALRSKDQELLKKYDELAQAIFIDMFGDPVKNEKGESLSTLIKINPTKSESKMDDNDEVTFIPMSNVGEDGSFNNVEVRKYSQVKSGFTYFREDDVLFAKITPCMENGKGAIAKELKNGIGFGSTEFHILRPNENLNNQFLFHLTKLINFRVFAEANMTGSAGQKRVPTDFFKKIKIDTTKLENQDEFAKAMNILLLQKQLIKKDIIDSTNLFQTLIQKAFKGELVS
jgi:type I restriction enzyme S subunit